MLKFENLAEVGQRIRAYDFQPIPESKDYPDRWVEGVVIAKGDVRLPGCAAPLPYRCYAVRADTCSVGQYAKGETVYVPFQLSIMEYDNRVTLVGALPARPATTPQEDKAAGDFPGV